MSLTSYRTAPPRVTVWLRAAAVSWALRAKDKKAAARIRPAAADLKCEWVYTRYAPASMPGDDLLFQRLSVSTIGAVRFHGRVRDGIGWGTDAMVTKQ